MRGRTLAAVCLCALIGGVSDAEAQYFGRNKVHYDRLDFRTLRTEHFDIYYYPEEQKATADAARMAERWYSRFSILLDHTFVRRQPLVLYASHPHFAQTNVTPASVGEGTGGLTEQTKSRIVMPFAAGLGETDHVLGHEIAHAFQIDIARRSHQNAFALPGWFIEGMAEYLSVGPIDAHTAMWLRDAALHHTLPTLEQLSDPRYFPYRYGHAFWSYLGATFGDGVVSQILRSDARTVIARLEKTTQRTAADLTKSWHESVSTEGATRRPGIPRPHRLVSSDTDNARVHVAPSISPDGRQVMFMSERDRLSLDLFVADALNGMIVRRIVSTATDPHFDSLQYIRSSGAWDPSGRRFALAALKGGNPVLTIVDVANPSQRRDIQLPGIGEAYNPSWSPDGRRIVFSALKGGISDLFVCDQETGRVQQLTADAFADMHPAWSPDGRTIALATDRFTSTLGDLKFGALHVGLLDLESGLIRPAFDDAPEVKQLSPQWSPDGASLYFVSDRNRISNVYRVGLAAGELHQVTEVAGGVSGITATSPALAVATQAGTLAFSVYRDGRYEIQTLDAGKAEGGLPVPATDIGSAELPDDAPDGALSRLLADSRSGLPTGSEFVWTTYDDRLRLESVFSPYVGLSTGTAFGGILRGSVGFTFGDTLRDRQLQTTMLVGTAADDFAAQVSYGNHRGQWNWGVNAGFVPSRFLGARRSLQRIENLVTRESSALRYSNQFASVTGRYNISRTRRLELRAGVRRTGFAWQTITRVIDQEARKTLDRDETQTGAGNPVRMAEAQAAFVVDTAVSGPTSPVVGQRLRLEVSPAVGELVYAGVRIDARRYFMPFRPLTIATRVEHSGRYGPGASDPRLTPMILGLPSMVRGYTFTGHAESMCGRTATSCSMVDELAGTRLGVANIELRAPLFGLLTGDLDYGRLPIEAIAFVDAGVLWRRHAGGPLTREPLRSIGAGGRANLGGIVLELTAARPLDLPGRGWTVSLLLRPGF